MCWAIASSWLTWSSAIPVPMLISEGNTHVYKSLKDLAEFFVQQQQPERAIYYFEQALEESKKIQSDCQYEIEATRHLALAHQRQGIFPHSRQSGSSFAAA